MLLEEGEPTVGGLHIGVRLAVFPAGVLSPGQADVGCFSQGVLAGIDASYLDVESRAAVAGGDDDRSAGKLTKGFEYGATELLQGGDVHCGHIVVDAVLTGSFGLLEFREGEMLGEHYW